MKTYTRYQPSGKAQFTQHGWIKIHDAPKRIARRNPMLDLLSYVVFILLIIGLCYSMGFVGFILAGLGL